MKSFLKTVGLSFNANSINKNYVNFFFFFVVRQCVYQNSSIK